MDEIFVNLLKAMDRLPSWIPGAAAALVGAIVLLAVIGGRRASLRRSALRMMDQGEKGPAMSGKLLAHPGVLERLVRERGDEVISYFGVADHLTRRLNGRRRVEAARRLLHLAPEDGAFPVFLMALKKDSVAAVFRNWMTEEEDVLVFRRMALSSRGQDFDGLGALKLLGPIIEAIREFSGDPEWPVRFFSLRVLLADFEAKSVRLVREAFQDSHPLIRRTAAAEARILDQDDSDKKKVLAALEKMVLDDPVSEVRRAAGERIKSIAPETWNPDPSALDSRQAVHILELLEVGRREDENLAIVTLQGENAEARFAAARFLEKCDTLERLLNEASRGDLEDWERRRALLSNAVSVGVESFLNSIGDSESIDVLLLGAYLLGEAGSVHLIPPLVDKAFSRADPTRSADEREFYRVAANLACSRGDERSRAMVRSELQRRKKDAEILSFILPLLPPEDAPAYRGVLLEFLVDPEFPADDAYVDLMSRLRPSFFLGPIFDILESPRSEYGYAVRLRALRCLGGWHLDYTLQSVLENLPVLHREEARDFAVHLEAADRKLFKERAGYILSSSDAGVRAALIACLPVSLVGDFSKVVREGLNDADPEVRIASLQTLFDAGELKATGPALSLLRDPVERVRVEAARLAGIKGSDKFLVNLEKVLRDDNESDLVRKAALEGLSASPAAKSVGVLVDFLNSGEDFREELMTAMVAKTDRPCLTELVEQFRDAEAVLRDRIAEVFAAMGTAGEEVLAELLMEEVPSLQPFLADILTRTGYVERLVRELGHRKPEVRRQAAAILAGIATESAYRGIVLAARDPDQEVRVQVVRALENLASPEGDVILKKLEQDPDRKVRRYTHWAMERLRAKRLV